MAYRYFLEVSYDGTQFHGSQIQGDLMTVQWAVNKAISTIVRQPVETFGASRTDEGVHANGNFYHFDVDAPLADNFLYKLNAVLPFSLAAVALYLPQPGAEANARFDAVSRSYRYRLYFKKDPFKYNRAYYYPYKFNRPLLDESAAILTEYTDFETFCKRNSQTFTHRCTLFDSHWEDHDGELHYVVKANRFLRGMVRALVGTQLKVAREKLSLSEFRQCIEAKDCTRADFSVPGHGLYLASVNYPEKYLKKVL